MPVRFQVDGDFYDHPKTLDMSDAATALWTRAGSYSAAKLTDGFVPDAMLARLSQTPEEAAQELVRRGLWKRVRGGHQFHQWEDRGNLTRERIEAERSADRQRKRRARQMADQNTNPQVNAGIVRAESGPESNVTPLGIRGLSVSVSKSVSESSSPLPPEGAKIPRAGNRGTRIPDPFTVDEAMKEWAVERNMQPQWVLRQTERFVNYWTAIPGTKGVKNDWRATWRNWLLKAQDDTPAASSPVSRNGYAKDDVRARFQ